MNKHFSNASWVDLCSFLWVICGIVLSVVATPPNSADKRVYCNMICVLHKRGPSKIFTKNYMPRSKKFGKRYFGTIDIWGVGNKFREESRIIPFINFRSQWVGGCINIIIIILFPNFCEKLSPEKPARAKVLPSIQSQMNFLIVFSPWIFFKHIGIQSYF